MRKMIHPVTVRKIKIGEGMPKICVPVVGVTEEEILSEARNAVTFPVDLVEWRGDWFADIAQPEPVKRVLAGLREILGEIPLLFTFRTAGEGGQREIDVSDYEAINGMVIGTGYADMVDVEFFMGQTEKEMISGNGESHDGNGNHRSVPGKTVRNLIDEAHAHDVKVIASNHDFEKTPRKDAIISRLRSMQDAGADIAKIAVMPQNKADVLELICATEEMYRLYGRIPLITMSMAGDGLISRMCGEVFGSAVTFGSAGKASAPGQIAAGELRNVLNILHDNL